MTNDANENTAQSTDEILKQRGSRYGTFEDHAELSQKLQDTVFGHFDKRSKETGYKLEPYMKESLILICHKLARIANGDPYYDDSWKDIAGYSELVVKILHKEGV